MPAQDVSADTFVLTFGSRGDPFRGGCPTSPGRVPERGTFLAPISFYVNPRHLPGFKAQVPGNQMTRGHVRSLRANPLWAAGGPLC